MPNNGKYSKKKILIIEENEDYLSVLKQYFTKEGAQVLPLSKLDLLDNIMKENRYDYIVCEYSMEKKNIFKRFIEIQKKYGYDASQFIRSKTIVKELKSFVKDKAQGQIKNDNIGEDNNVIPFKKKEEISPNSDPSKLPSIKDILSRNNSGGAENSLINLEDFIEENFKGTFIYQVSGKSMKCNADILEFDDQEFLCAIIQSSKNLALCSGLKNIIFDVSFIRGKQKYNFSLKGEIASIEDGPFFDKILHFSVASNSKRDLQKILKIKTDRQNEVANFFNKVKGF